MIDKSSQFFAILTAVGEAKHANAIAMGLDWMFTEMGLGDANGTDPIPDRLQTQLINEWRRAPINQIRVDAANLNTVITEQIIPPEVGGEWIREIGLYDVDGDLVAVANCAPSYKPLLDQGSGKTQVVRMNFIVSSSANIVLKIDPAVVLATREYVDTAISEALAKLDSKQSVRVATTDDIALSGAQTLDGVAVIAGDRVLVTAQNLGEENGIYVVAADAWMRASDADADVEVTPGLFVHVEEGVAAGDTLWQLVTDAPITLGVTALQFETLIGPSGVIAGTFRSVTVDALGRVIAGTNPTTLDGYGITDALAAAENLADLTDAAAARDNLVLGTAATANVQADLDDPTVNALMKVGAFGLGGDSINLPDGTDLNTVVIAGFYRIEDAPINGPSDSSNSIMIVGSDGNAVLQLIVKSSTGLLYTRGGGGGGSTWSAWKTQWDNGSLVKQANATDAAAGRVLLNGAFGVGGAAPNLPGNDFNAAQVGGIYTYESDTLNRPNVANGTSHGLVIHMERSYGNLAYQQVHAANSATFYRYRTGDFASGTWSEWQHVWDSSNLDPADFEVPPATESVSGITRFATPAETIGDNRSIAITPFGLQQGSQASPSDDAPGKHLMTGAYGWGQGGIVIADGTDLDTILSAGVYRVNTGPNVPEGGQYSPMLVMVAQDVVTQMIITSQSGTIYTRGMITDMVGWGPWSSSQSALGFTPVQQGGGVGQEANKIHIGFKATPSTIGLQVDSSDFGDVWCDNYGIHKVRNCVVAFVVGEVGSYAMFRVHNGVGTTPGTLVAGGNLIFTDAGAQSSHGNPGGTWMLMGGLQNADGTDDDSAVICLRVA